MVIDPATGRVDPQSALPVTFNGAKITGCGKDDEGDSKNIIQDVYKRQRLQNNRRYA